MRIKIENISYYAYSMRLFSLQYKGIDLICTDR